MNPGETAGRCMAQLPEGFRQENEPVFREPWQAQAFSLAVHLIESGRISWQEWAEALGAGKGCLLNIEAEGADAGDAITALDQLVKNGFGE